MLMTPASDNDLFKTMIDDSEDSPTVIESLCVRCENNGTTRLLLLSIPFHRQVILLSFHCEHCGFSNNEVQSAESVQEKGIDVVLKVQTRSDLDRFIVRSEYAETEIPELNLVIPPKSQPGDVTTVEGILNRVRAGLEQDQEIRRREHTDIAEKIDDFVFRIGQSINLEHDFTLHIKDASGNSFVQNPFHPQIDPNTTVSHYERNIQDQKLLCLLDDEAEELAPKFESYDEAKQEVLRFNTSCPNCGSAIDTRMKPTDIPHFATVIIMCTTCDSCGYKSNEVKSGSGISDKGLKITVSVEEERDFCRDVVKSDTCSVSIPELEIEVGSGAIPGRFTTIEGLVNDIRVELKRQEFFFVGDSADEDKKAKFGDLFDKFEKILSLELKAHVVLDDPAGNSYVQSLFYPMDDERLKKTYYERTFEQNEELALNDMKTENYGEMKTISEDSSTTGSGSK